MDTIRRGDMVYIISKNLSLTEDVVRRTLVGYVNYVKQKLDKNESVNILNIATLKVRDYDGYLDTLAYACTEVAKEVNISPLAVKEILSYYEEQLLYDIRDGYDHSLTGLVTVSIEKGRLVVSKSRLLGKTTDFRLKTIRSFKRKVES